MGQEKMEYPHHGNGSKDAHQRVERGEVVEVIVVDFGEHTCFVGCHIRGADTEDEVIAPLKKTTHRMKTLCSFEKGNAPVTGYGYAFDLKASPKKYSCHHARFL